MPTLQRGLAVAAAVAVALTGGAVAAEDEIAERDPDAVVAFIDTGINPYHVEFRDDSPDAYEHPSTYLPGFPEDAVALELTLDAPNYWAAVREDCERVWRNVERGQLYWFPGTKIVGGISFSNPGSINCNTAQPGGMLVLDSGGHGTMVASRGAATTYGACPECRIVAVQGFTADSVRWAGEHAGWIDAQSNSWGATVPLWLPTGAAGNLVNNPDGVRAYEEAAQQHLVFWASGNGLATRGGLVGLPPTTTDPRLTPSAIAVGGHDSGYVNTWPNFPPHVVSDSCNSWAAFHRSLDESSATRGSGTSAASPFAAAGAAQILRDARLLLGDSRTGVHDGIVAEGDPGQIADGPLADGVLTMAEWKDIVLGTATPRPEGQEEDGPPCGLVDGLVLYSATPVQWRDVPDDYPEYLHIGYGAVDGPSVELAGAVLRGEEPMPDRSETDDFFAAEGAVRGQLHEIYRGG